MPFDYWLSLTAVLTAVLLLLFSRLAFRLDWVDRPAGRKIHTVPVPTVGGVVIYLVVAVISMLLYRQWPLFIWPLLAGALLLVVVGALDDRWELAPGWRFAAQAVAIMIVIGLTGVHIESFGFLLSDQWPLALGIMAIPLTLFGIIGVINAINMADGIDGLAATLVLIPLLLLGLMVPDDAWRRWFAVLGVVVLVFLVFNLSGGRFRVFLGDAGSLLLGFILAWLVVYFSQGSHRVIFPVTALWLLALPVFDTIFVMTQRMLAGRSPFSPDRRHLHHVFLRLGYSARKTLLVMAVYALILAQAGWLMLHFGVPEHWQFAAFVSLSLVYYFSLRRVWKKLDEELVGSQAAHSSEPSQGASRSKSLGEFPFAAEAVEKEKRPTGSPGQKS